MMVRKITPRWTKCEIKYLEDNAKQSTIRELMVGLPNRTYNSIHWQMKKRRLDIKCGRHRNGNPIRFRVRKSSPLYDVFNGN